MIKMLIVWLVPPVIGAVIGYVTNALAIKMLFRPLAEKRLFGIRVPFTPGILPKQRHELARNIGRMVERELLTAEILRQRLLREDFRAGVKNSVAVFTGKILSTPVNRYRIEENGAAEDALSAVAAVAGDLFQGFFRSPAFEALFESLWKLFAEEGKAAFGNKTILEIAGNERLEKIRIHLEKNINGQIQSKSGFIAGQAAVMLCNMFPQISGLCIDFLNRPDVRRTLEARGRVFLSDAIEKLGSFQRFFLSMGQYDVRLSEKMPEIIDDFVRQLGGLLANPNEQRKIIELFTDSTERFLSNKENGGQIAKIFLDFVITCADKPLKEFFLTSGGGSPDGASASFNDLGKEFFSSIKNKLSGVEYMESGTRDTAKGAKTAGFFKQLLEEHADWSLSSVFLITNDKKEKLDSLLSEKLLALAGKEIASLLRSINIRVMVEERIDQLDMIQVEHIILDIMANQLKWINVLGAVLGAFIGIFQSVFSWFTRGL